MAMRKFIGAIRVVIQWFEKRPWIPMAIYLGIFALFVLSGVLLLTDMIDSRWRPFGDFTKEEKAVISHIGDYIGWAVIAAAAFSVAVAPFMMLCVGRFRAAFNMLVMGIAGIGASVTFFFVTGPLWFVIGLESAKATDAFGDKGAIIESYKDYDETCALRQISQSPLPKGRNENRSSVPENTACAQWLCPLPQGEESCARPSTMQSRRNPCKTQ